MSLISQTKETKLLFLSIFLTSKHCEKKLKFKSLRMKITITKVRDENKIILIT